MSLGKRLKKLKRRKTNKVIGQRFGIRKKGVFMEEAAGRARRLVERGHLTKAEMEEYRAKRKEQLENRLKNLKKREKQFKNLDRKKKEKNFKKIERKFDKAVKDLEKIDKFSKGHPRVHPTKNSGSGVKEARRRLKMIKSEMKGSKSSKSREMVEKELLAKEVERMKKDLPSLKRKLKKSK